MPAADLMCRCTGALLDPQAPGGAEVNVAVPLDESETLLSRMKVSSPTTVIKRHLDEFEPDLVAFGTRGLSGLQRLRVGSTASSIARTASCSVLVASAHDDESTS